MKMRRHTSETNEFTLKKYTAPPRKISENSAKPFIIPLLLSLLYNKNY
jgi:hypothetical protein